jgi:hypothetical protein
VRGVDGGGGESVVPTSLSVRGSTARLRSS